MEKNVFLFISTKLKIYHTLNSVYTHGTFCIGYPSSMQANVIYERSNGSAYRWVPVPK